MGGAAHTSLGRLMRGLADRAGRRLGYRGAGLLVCGMGWINWGLGLVCDPRYGAMRGAAALTAIPHTSIALWGWVWIASGAVCCAASVMSSGKDWWGWAAAVAMPVVWAAAYTSARALGEFPQGLNSGLTWLVSPSLAALLAAATARLVLALRENTQLRREVDTLRPAAAHSREAGQA
ncbi:hypothetical protein ACFV3N_16900 [Streptomyces bauhiniae]|uniref:hypothetical protein n=1 Tax=Streptomyces bauhiniae TaxID=2340725 RepID=UPI003663FA63